MVVREEVRDPGFWLDKNMRLEKQVTKVGQAAYAHLRMLHRVRRYLGSQHMLLLAHSLVISCLCFCTSLYKGVTQKLEQKLQRIVKAALRVALNHKSGTGNDTNAILRQCRCLPVGM